VLNVRDRSVMPSCLARIALFLASTILGARAVAQECEDWLGELVSVEGTVEISRAESELWSQAASGDVVCVEDSVRVLGYSRALLRQPDGAMLRLTEGTTLRGTAGQTGERSLWDLIRGLIHVISRDRRSLRFTTPFANAGLEGTEFVIGVSETQTEITVVEGVVEMSAAEGTTVRIAPGERGTAARSAAPAVAPAPDLPDFLAWAVHYSPVWSLDAPEPEEEPGPGRLSDPQFYAGRAARRLSVGSVDSAREDIARTLAIDPDNADALALQAAVATDLNDPDEALRLAEAAVMADPGSGTSLLALALVQQSRFDLPAAREILRRAVATDPANAIAWARLAELELEMANLPAARESARRAAELDPGLPHARTVLGFADLMDLRFADAETSFRSAISLDQAAPLPRLGLGLALIRRNRLEAGRAELELAVFLSPNDAIVRSYVAKAYYDERREALSALLLELAQGLDADEPTSWIYAGLLKQAENRPIAAIRDFRRAATLSDDEPVYRSRLRLDEDLAVRSAAYARPFRDLGFDELALVSGRQSVLRAPSDYSGHRMLADSYSGLSRHQIARVNELFVSQLLQPVNQTAIPPQLGEPNLFVGDFLGADSLAFSEFNPLLTRNHLTVQGSGLVAGNDTRSHELTVSGIEDRFSFSLGQFDFETDGLRENNDIDTRVRNIFVQGKLAASTNLLAEIRSTDTEKGDLGFLFDPGNFNSLLRQSDEVDALHLGFHHAWNERSEFLGTAQYYDGDSTTTIGPTLSFGAGFEGYSYELQSHHALRRWHITTGVTIVQEDLVESSLSIVPEPFPPFQLVEQVTAVVAETEQLSAYSYSQFSWTDKLTGILGASFDSMDSRGGDYRNVSPKLGLVWEPAQGTTVRIAAFRTLQGPLVSKEIIRPRLEPTQVAGFNQFFFGAEGDEATRLGLGLDREGNDRFYYGAELSARNVQSTIVAFDPGGGSALLPVEIDETLARAYAYWTLTDTVAFSAEFQRERIDNNGDVLADGYATLSTTRLPLGVRYFHPRGLRAGFEASYVDQSGDFGQLVPGPGGIVDIINPDSDSFWVADAFIGYRLPGRHGILSLHIQNLTDETFRFQDTDPENPSIMPERLVSLRLTLAL
jgi:tetratricopeptide (TPR) repeat protein